MPDDIDDVSSEPMFSVTELEKLRKAARDKVAKEIRDLEMKRLMAEFEEEERVAAGLAPSKGEAVKESEKVQVTIDLPPFADELTIDGKKFFQGHSYWVSPNQFSSMLDQMEMSWSHEDRNQPRGKMTRTRSRHQTLGLPMGPVKINTARSMQ